jgi:hypothetical protein
VSLNEIFTVSSIYPGKLWHSPLKLATTTKFSSLYVTFYVFEKWVERCKKCIACQGRYFEEETVIAPPQSSDSE